jgi:DNA-binding NtrC family response regulator
LSVAQGAFRQDLYYRLRVVELRIPPLRERVGDVALLAHRFVADHARVPGARLSGATLKMLEAHDWPGNVRELANAIERACLLSPEAEIRPEVLPDEIQARRPQPRPSSSGEPGAVTFRRFDKQELEDVMAALTRRVEREFVDGLLSSHEGNVSKAAAESGIHRSHLQRMMARLK